MLELSILLPAILNGLTIGAIYALIALGLTLIYGVLHIINFAHGSLLMLALYGVFFLHSLFGIDPYLALPVAAVALFGIGYGLQRFIIGRASHGKDENILLVTLGLSVIIGISRSISGAPIPVPSRHRIPSKCWISVLPSSRCPRLLPLSAPCWWRRCSGC